MTDHESDLGGGVYSLPNSFEDLLDITNVEFGIHPKMSITQILGGYLPDRRGSGDVRRNNHQNQRIWKDNNENTLFLESQLLS
jgi:hypothetical protein